MKLIQKSFPNVIMKRIFHGIEMCREIGLKHDEIEHLLKQHRRNYVKYIAMVGITFNKSPKKVIIENLYPIHYKYLPYLRELDEAYQALHKYSEPNGADEYIAKGVINRVVSIKASENGKKPRNSKRLTDSDIDKIVNYFIKRDLQNSDIKKEIYLSAKSLFSIENPDGTFSDISDHQINIARQVYILRKNKLN